jgi:hypothetical protein
MCRYRPIIIAVVTVILAGCTQENLPPGVLEFEVPAGKFRVTTPENWVETPELGGFTAVESPDLDLVFGVLSVAPSDEEMSVYPNPRDYQVNGRQITVHDGPPGRDRTSLYFGIEHYPEDAFHAVVQIGEHRYHVVLVRSNTVVLRDDHEQILVNLAASLEPVP